MRNFIQFIVGLLSMFVTLCGFICAIQAIATGIAFYIVCALVFALAWGYVVLDYFRNKVFEDVAELICEKLNIK